MEKGKRGELPNKHSIDGIFLDSVDLMELLVASHIPDALQMRNWAPGKEIQLPNFLVRINDSLREAIRILLDSGTYEERNEGRGNGNLVLTPNQIDETVQQAISLCGFDTLYPLIELLKNFFPHISSITLLPNTSIGLRDKYGNPSVKLNGMVMELSSKRGTQQLLEKINLPLGRGVSLYSLNGIDVESFIYHYADGKEIIERISGVGGVKFIDFFYNGKGEIFVAIAAGGERRFNFSGPPRVINEQLEQLYRGADNTRRQLAEAILRPFGVSLEEVTSFPYVGLNNYNQDKGVILVSGASFLPGSDTILFNGGPTNDSILFSPPREDYIPIGGKGGNLVTRIKPPLLPQGQVLTPVRKFGLE